MPALNIEIRNLDLSREHEIYPFGTFNSWFYKFKFYILSRFEVEGVNLKPIMSSFMRVNSLNILLGQELVYQLKVLIKIDSRGLLGIYFFKLIFVITLFKQTSTCDKHDDDDKQFSLLWLFLMS